MKTLTSICLGSTILFVTTGYASSQKGLNADQVRKVVRQEIHKALKSHHKALGGMHQTSGHGTPSHHGSAAKGHSKAHSKTHPKTGKAHGVFMLQGKPHMHGGAKHSSSIHKTLAAAEQAIEKNKQLSKKQRVTALKGLAIARKAVGTNHGKAHGFKWIVLQKSDGHHGKAIKLELSKALQLSHGKNAKLRVEVMEIGRNPHKHHDAHGHHGKQSTGSKCPIEACKDSDSGHHKPKTKPKKFKTIRIRRKTKMI